MYIYTGWIPSRVRFVRAPCMPFFINTHGMDLKARLPSWAAEPTHKAVMPGNILSAGPHG